MVGKRNGVDTGPGQLFDERGVAAKRRDPQTASPIDARKPTRLRRGKTVPEAYEGKVRPWEQVKTLFRGGLLMIGKLPHQVKIPDEGQHDLGLVPLSKLSSRSWPPARSEEVRSSKGGITPAAVRNLRRVTGMTTSLQPNQELLESDPDAELDFPGVQESRRGSELRERIGGV